MNELTTEREEIYNSFILYLVLCYIVRSLEKLKATLTSLFLELL
jgi:hypothetical protein